MRKSGVLMHISSLPGKLGIGTLGKSAYEFVDFLVSSGQSYWQVLPICPTGYGDSPYQSFSTFAGNPYFIDLDLLSAEGLLDKADHENVSWGKNEQEVDYATLYKERYKVFKKLSDGYIPTDEYRKFCAENSKWLDEFALFMAIKDAHGGKAFYDWEKDIKSRKQLAYDFWKEKCTVGIKMHKLLQFLFYRQWNALKKYANEQGIKIIGDLPIYVSGDSSDVWANQKIFKLDSNYLPVEVAGCPPDDFSKDGQLWGNPVYDWKYLKQTDYAWWIERLKHCLNVYDVIRLDHFRGFESYYCVKYGSVNARSGVWRKGPGIDFFKSVEKQLGKLPIIAEDLGFMTDGVKKLLKRSHFPGMKILQFAFDGNNDSEYLPHNYSKNSVAYTGTHDNTTVQGWFETANKQTKTHAVDYLRLDEEEGYNWGMMKSIMASASDTVILTMQDLLGLGSRSRMNIPSTVSGNWKWRAVQNDFSQQLAEKLYYFTDIYKRLPTKSEGKIR